MSLAPGARLGAYEVVSQIGAGGMGEVYRGRDTRLNRDVAQGNMFQYAPGIGGRRFLVNVFTADSEPALHVITNWRPKVSNE